LDGATTGRSPAATGAADSGCTGASARASNGVLVATGAASAAAPAVAQTPAVQAVNSGFTVVLEGGLP
jgi:hypothetical protein